MHSGYGNRTVDQRNSDYAATTAWFDNSGKLILGSDGLPLLLPSGFDMQSVLTTAAATSQYDLVRTFKNLANFGHAGPWNLQRQEGHFNVNLVDSATVLIGAYAATSGLHRDSILAIESSFGIVMSNWKAGTVMSPEYPSLPTRNVSNTDTGYGLVGSGRLKVKLGG